MIYLAYSSIYRKKFLNRFYFLLLIIRWLCVRCNAISLFLRERMRKGLSGSALEYPCIFTVIKQLLKSEYYALSNPNTLRRYSPVFSYSIESSARGTIVFNRCDHRRYGCIFQQFSFSYAILSLICGEALPAYGLLMLPILRAGVAYSVEGP